MLPATEEIPVDLEAILKSGRLLEKTCRCSGATKLKFRSFDHKLTEQWSVLQHDTIAALDKCISRTVQIVVKGQTNSVVLGVKEPQQTNPNAAASLPVIPRWPGQETPVPPGDFRLADAVQRSGMLLASSDTSRVRVTRRNPATGQIETRVFDIDKTRKEIRPPIFSCRTAM